MSNWVPVDAQAHRAVRILTGAAARFGDDVGVISVLPCEFPRLLAHYAIFLRKSAETGRFEPAALLGFGNRENLFLVGERWDADYVPLQVQRQPFSVLPGAEGAAAQRGELQLAFDADSPRVGAQRGEALFHENGEPTPYLRRMAGVLNTFVAGASEALQYCARLAELDLIEPIRIDAQFVDGSEVKLQGLYTIRADALQALPGPRLVELRDQGFLRLAYYQLASGAHLASLIARKNRKLTGGSASGVMS